MKSFFHPVPVGRWLAVVALFPGALQALEIKTGEKGFVVHGGSLGNFEIGYPVFTDPSNKETHPLVEARAEGGRATLKYQGGGSIELDAAPDGQVTMTFSATPADVKGFTVTMLIDIAFNKGGKWKAGETEGDFPKEKAAKPQFFSGNVPKLTVANAQGASLGVEVPQYSFMQLTDNREWGWAIYAWRNFVNVDSSTKTVKYKFSVTSGDSDRKLVDDFGQSTLENWPSKVKSESELKEDVSREAAYYAGLKMPERDAFGGLPGSGAKLGLKKSGFFHVERHGGKWWLVDPEGNAFFHTGLCGFQPSDDFTYVKGREGIYTWLPEAGGPFATAFRSGDPAVFSYYVANTIRKYGEPYDHDQFASRMIGRVRKWGFNSIGAFSAVPPKAAAELKFPYVLSLPLNEWEAHIARIPGVAEVFDPFDDKTRQAVESQLAKELPKRADDPLLIGYFIINEPRYDELPKVVPSLDGKHACKRELVEFLKKKYGGIAAFNAAWGMDAKDFESLADRGLPAGAPAAMADLKEFTAHFLETMFQLVEGNFRKHDKNHLLIGNRLQPVTIKNEELCRIMGKHVDVVSFNYYTYEVDKDLLRRIAEWSGKPIMLSEFFWSSPRDSGLAGGRSVLTQQERGLIYRNYVEQAASLGSVIGIEWFTLIDQASTGRWFSKYNGESFNTGIFSVADRPWVPMVTEMAKTNHGIYEVLLGEREPFSWEHVNERGN